MPEASFRFYEELNDFLPRARRKSRFAHHFKEKASIKDMIESLGVPHTEVDLILVNDESVDFNCIVQDGDRISVYPVFESFNIKQVSKVRPEPLRETRFILDVHLGKLARTLRMLGFDAEFRSNYTPDEIISISLSEKRIILSKSRNLLKRKEITHGYCLGSSDPETQANLVLKRFDLGEDIEPFTRCMECNTLLESVSGGQVAEQVPQDVLDIQDEFKICRECEKVYWRGSHFQKMKERVLELQNNCREF